jgi:uncharacterized protein YdeI (YjbR/CyaY-like superfamily)
MATTKALKKYQPKSRADWRRWLQNNHDKEPGVWMVYHKKETGKKKIELGDAVEEALCFGWIDSIQQKLDDERTMLKFTPRKSRSVWSAINKARIERLMKDEQMMEAGKKAIDLAKTNGSWNLLNKSDEHTTSNTIPADLRKALKANKTALKNFQAFAPSHRKRFLSWIDGAKREETRNARIQQTVLMSAANKKPDAAGFKL